MDINNIISQLQAYRTIKDINDAIRNGQLSKDAAQKLQEYFAQYDLNSDGTISTDEYSYWSKFAEFSDEQWLDTPESDDNAAEAPSTPKNDISTTPPIPTENPKEGEPPLVNAPDAADETASQVNSQYADKPDVQKDLEENIITYPKSGENFKMTAKRLGFKEGTPEFEEFVKANSEASKKNYFTVGQQVKIPAKIQNKVNKNEILNINQSKEEVAKYKKTASSSKPDPKGRKSVRYPQSVQDRINELKKHKAKFDITNDSNGSYLITMTKSNYMDKIKASEILIQYDKNGKMVSQRNKYQNGKVIETTYAGGRKAVVKQQAAPQAYQAYAEKCQKRDGGDYHLEFNTESKKWILVQKFDNKEVRHTLQMKNNNKISGKKQNSKATVQNVNLDHFSTKIPGFEDVNIEPGLPHEMAKRKVYPADAKYPAPIRDCLAALRGSGAEVEVTENDDGHYSVTITRQNQYNTTAYLINNRSYGDFICTVVNFDEKGNMLEAKQKYTYREVTTQFRHERQVGKKKVSRYTNPDNAETQPTTESKFDDHIAADIKISLPQHYKQNSTASAFSKSIADNKAALMKMLGITNTQYDELASVAMGIAEQETHFGEYEYKDTKGKKHGNLRLMGKDLATDVGTITHKNIGKISIYGSDHSWGVTQINWNKNFEGDVEPNPTLRRQAAKFGITSYKDYQYNPEKAAILTMILLNNKRIIAESREWQERLAENNAQIDNNTNYTTKQKEEKKITTTDIIALLWNGMSGIPQRFDNPYKYVTIDDNNSGMVTRNGNKIKDGISYARNVRAYRNKFFSVDRLEGSHENNGKIGTVLFMPTAFAGNQKATKSDFEILERALGTKAGIDNAKKDAMLAALRSGYFSFGYGLTEEEAESITANDIDIILEKVDKVKDFVQANNSPKERRNFAKLIQDEFRAEYLKSRQIIVNISDVNRNTVIRAFRYQGDVDNRLSENRNVRITAAHIGSRVQGQAMNAVRSADAAETSGVRYGFRVERDKGVNPYDENGKLVPNRQRILAEYASTVAQRMNTGGQCLTGVKLSLESAGIVKKGDITYPRWHKDAGKTIGTPRDTVIYFEEHPEMFTRVKYVDIGNGQARELNASDIRNLPAGYIGIYIPGPGYENQAGHAFITNGNSQGYSDETDNLRWDDFKSYGAGNGKGEHGHYVIYKLTDGWQVDPATGKLVFKG